MIERTLGHYKVVAKLGEGGMGEVYRATDLRLGREVALKVLPANVAADPERIERFQREARAVAALNHPGIVTIYSVEEADEVHFLTMELVEGQSLDRLIPTGGLDVERIASIGQALAGALAAAHDKGIIHRDLKPANVMVTPDGAVKVLDFGLAKVVEPDAGDEAETATTLLTAAGVVMGTRPYMSPEQIQARPVDHRTDIFSLGVMLYEMATGHQPFHGPSSAELFASILRDSPPGVTEIRAELPADLSRVVRRCLEKDPRDRIQTARDVGNQLRERTRRTAPGETLEPVRPASGEASGETGGDSFRVAVLPFRYTGSHDDLSTLAEGLPEEIVTGLSRFSYLRVIAHSATRQFAGDAVDVRAAAREIGARYFLHGSLRRAGTTLRVAVQLVDADTGAHLWAETYNRPFDPAEIFAMQDDLVSRIVSTVADWYGILPRSMSEAVRSTPVDQLSPYEALLRAFGYYSRVTPGEHAAARLILERAVERAPGYASAWAMLSMLYGEEDRFGFNPLPDPLGRALQAAQRAVETAPESHVSYLALAQAHYFRKERDAFRSAAERALALNALDGATVEYLAHLLAFSGNWERGRELGDRARELNPHHPAWYWSLPLLDAYRRGDYQGARVLIPNASMPGQFFSHALFAAVYGQLGDDEPARREVHQALSLRADFAEIARDQFGRWYLPELVEHLIEGLRKAGLEIALPTSQTAEAASPSTAPARTPDSGQARAEEGFWVAVLPFKASGQDAAVAALADGISEAIVTGLSRFSYLRVIARSSTTRYAGEAVDVRAVGQQLGARYVMEGSLRQAGAALRVTVQLVDAETGAHLWADTYHRPFDPTGIFTLQDDLVPRIVSTVADAYGVLPHSMSEALRSRDPRTLSPHEVLLRGMGYSERLTADEHAQVRDMLERAVREAPGHADCWALLSSVYNDEHRQGFNPKPGALDRALEAARRAVRAAPSNGFAHQALAHALFFRREFQAFRAAADRSIVLNPMDGSTIAFMGILIAYAGDWDRGCALVEEAIELNPHAPGWYRFALFFNAFRKRDYRTALDIALRMNLPTYFFTHAAIAAAYGKLDEREAARGSLQELLALKPHFGTEARQEYEKWFGPGELVEDVLDGLRKAGLAVPQRSS